MQKIPTALIVVAAALIGKYGQILMHRRRLGREHGGLWEFPGGKIEDGEAPETALCRELEEELGLAVNPAVLAPAGFASGLADSGRPIVILLYTCAEWQGDPQCLEGEAIAWFAPEALASLAMPPLDVPLAQGLLAALKKAN